MSQKRQKESARDRINRQVREAKQSGSTTDYEISSKIGLGDKNSYNFAKAARQRALKSYEINYGDKDLEVEVSGAGEVPSAKKAGGFTKIKNLLVTSSSFIPLVLVLGMMFFFHFCVTDLE